MKQEEVDNYCGRVPVDRLVLACHGIGQKLAVSNIAHDAACMRLLMRQLSQVCMHPSFLPPPHHPNNVGLGQRQAWGDRELVFITPKGMGFSCSVLFSLGTQPLILLRL